MSGMGDSLAAVDPIELVARRRFSRLTAVDERALAHEVQEARVNLARLKTETMQRRPEWFA